MNGKAWTKEDVDYIKKNYQRMTCEEIANKLGRTEAAVKQYACRHGIKSCYYTPEDDEYIELYYGKMTIDNIAKRLRKTSGSVRKRVYVLGIGGNAHCQSDMIHLAEIGRILGIEADYIRKHWIVTGKMPSKKFGKFRMVKPKDLMKFMQDNPDEWSAINCERFMFDNEKWFHEKLLQERHELYDERWA